MTADSTDHADGTDGVFGTRAHPNRSRPCTAFRGKRDLDAQRPEERLRPPQSPTDFLSMVCPSRCQRGHPPHTNVRGRTRFRPTWSSRAHRPSSGTDLLAIRVRSFWRFRTLTPRSFRSARTAVALKAIARQGGPPGRGASRLPFAFQDQRAMSGFFLILAANSTSHLIASARDPFSSQAR